MKQSRLIVGVTLSTIVGTSGVASGYAQQSAPAGGIGVPPPVSAPAPLTPSMKARSDEIYRLNSAAAVAQDASKYAEAEADARQSVSLGIGSGLGQELLAAALDAQGKTQEAFQAYKVIADQGNAFPRNLLPYALLSLKVGHWAQAVGAYNRQLPYLAEGELMRNNSHFSVDVPQPRELAAAIHIGLGLTEDWRGYNWTTHSREQTLVQFEQALILEPDSDLANYYYAQALQRLGRSAQASAAFQKTVKMAKGEVKAAALRALKGSKKPA